MNLQKRMALMKMKASLAATLPRNTHKKRRKLKKEKTRWQLLGEISDTQLGLQKRKKGREGRKSFFPGVLLQDHSSLQLSLH